jgi:hypothetical protein
MWISIFAMTFAIALILCVAAIMMQFDRISQHRNDTLRVEIPEAPAPPTPQLPAQEYAENTPRPVSSSLPEHLQWHYRSVLNEPIPSHLTALVRRFENLTLPLRGT